ncbi:hypothetical protein CAPTEDRAFT_225146 [Capitella teleta]|uniref:Protein quiver n=1 Tax=Capitella teleta TaxID=283909 RepID=R7U1N7_CAPTE|nr:hypothetical protein CAPTEDRAFT_225146 [Capitella teleta]|eukprot:ELT99879.1 hypothetical protein CAPTEDRAFT_225146 [Capitella teleta]
MGTNHVILLAFLACVISSVWAMECYKCSDFEVEASNPLLKDLIEGKSSPECKWGLGSPTVSCASNAVCGLVKGSVEAHSFLGHFKMKTYVRDCVEAMPDGCISELNDATNIINGVLEVALAFVSKLGSLNIDANLCSCSFDMCNPDPCDDGEVNFFNLTCLNVWILVGAGAGLFLLILSCCICCCCCCCCKKRNTGHGVVIMSGGPPGYTGVVMASSVPNGVQVDTNDGGLVNPMYGNTNVSK